MKTIPIISIPFTSDGLIDYDSYINTLEYLQKRVEHSILFGIASEYMKLTDCEKLKLVEITSKNKGSMKVFYSITDHSLEVAKYTIDAYEMYNPDGYMILAPFNYQPSKKQLIKHIVELANYVEKPTIVQIAPNETGLNFEYEELYQIYLLTKCAFKIEGPEIYNYISELKNKYPEIKIFNGYAGIYLDKMLDIGADAIVPGCSFVELYSDLISRYADEKISFEAEFKEISENLFKWMQHTEKIIAVEKYILYKRNVIKTSYCRMPNYELNSQEIENIDNFILKKLKSE